MKYVIIIFAIFSVYANGGVIGGTDTLAPAGKSGVIGDVDTLRKLPSIIDIKNNDSLYLDLSSRTLLKSGDFDFDSTNNRWILKTRERILSVKSIELIDEYQDKQIEVLDYSSNIKKSLKNMGTRMLERRIKMGVKFKNFKFKDFNY
ncbi:hypothetical protein ABMA79_13555 [Halobacteriovorax sp. HFRX-2_2]|uniref:hypothetical protein n=1 Tax=unclassified Halobacteriovorax TaxID=2639665 RepID=UPI00372262B4